MSRTKPENITFVTFHVVLALVILAESVLTIRSTLAAMQSGHHDPHGLLLGAPEALAAALFLVPRTRTVAGAALLAILGIAIVLHVLRGDRPLALLVYAAGVALVMARGRD